MGLSGPVLRRPPPAASPGKEWADRHGGQLAAAVSALAS